MQAVHGLISDGTNVVFMGVPSHVGMAGNAAVIVLQKLPYSCQ